MYFPSYRPALVFCMMSSIHHCELIGHPPALGQQPKASREERNPRTNVQQAPEHVQKCCHQFHTERLGGNQRS